MMQKQNIDLEFMGQKIPVKTEGDSEIVSQIVELAQQKLDDAKKRAAGAAAHQIAVLALLDMTEEYVKARNRATEQRSKLTERSESIVRQLEAELQ